MRPFACAMQKACARACARTRPQALRRLRLPLFYDSAAWVLPAGTLMHLLITLPYWTRCARGARGRRLLWLLRRQLWGPHHARPPPRARSELWLGNAWLGANAVPLAVAALFVLTSGAYLEVGGISSMSCAQAGNVR